MTAIVFCASLAPWEYDTSAAVGICNLRNVRFSGAGRAPWKITSSALIPSAARAKPAGGEMTSESTVFQNSEPLTPARPCAAAMAAPLNAPTSACVELLGSPRYQVMRFQAIAPISPAMITTRPTLKATIFPMVLDTLAWKKTTVITAPARFSTAEIRTAIRGETARVETELAIALAVSCKPHVNSQPNTARRG